MSIEAARTDLDIFFREHTLNLEFSVQHEVGKVACPFHHHPGIEMVFHDGGAGVTNVRGHPAIAFSPNSTVIYPPLAMHDQCNSQPGVDICLQLAAASPLPSLLAKPLYIDAGDDPFIVREFRELQSAWRGAGGLARISLNHRATALLARLLQSVAIAHDDVTPADAAARQAMDCILSRFGKLTSLDEVARSVGLSYHYLRHVFKHRYGISMKQAIIKARIDYARELLVLSPLPQKAIAAQCGFTTERHFSAVFHGVTGMTPGSYRHRRTAREPITESRARGTT